MPFDLKDQFLRCKKTIHYKDSIKVIQITIGEYYQLKNPKIDAGRIWYSIFDANGYITSMTEPRIEECFYTLAEERELKLIALGI